MMIDAATIRAAIVDEAAKRRPFWIGGVPMQSDIRGIRNLVAHRLGITPEAVRAVLTEIEVA